MEQALLAGVATKIGETLAEEAMKKKSASSKQDEAQLLSQIHSSMERIKSEFEVMQAFLNRVDKQRDEVTEAWLKRVRDVASQVEKIVDEFAKIVRGPSKKLSKALLETLSTTLGILLFHMLRIAGIRLTISATICGLLT
ncbi:Peptidase S8 propeptide/proteinase inhibitor I9 domain-containing protein [Dioscorea alata]|uniref:Peptidase S8 propeptide/proteinase inhibitor I9 domain-containing protein n=1 Tax=Dioscorea alata TaxID=55571 RepID=A0ACB7WM34_DIOAL|nr:Peptidase S8 propeptide/proteinase inhibitor I9 domain-containing protein [Dioscorea alata]